MTTTEQIRSDIRRAGYILAPLVFLLVMSRLCDVFFFMSPLMLTTAAVVSSTPVCFAALALVGHHK